MKVVNIGRSSSNDVNINDPHVSRLHCQIIQNDYGDYILIDKNSANGTYVNGRKISGQIKLTRHDIVRIGNAIIPWQTYFSNSESDPEDWEDSDDEGTKSVAPPVLGIVALILSLVGAVLLIYVFILVAKWGIFAFIGKGSTYLWVSVGINIIAYILATIADYNDYVHSDKVSETNVANVAKTISGIGIFLVIGFYLYLRFGNTSALNPFK